MKKAYRSLILVPRIKFLTAHKNFAADCSRCERKIGADEIYILHSTDGHVHARCLKVDTRKGFIGRAAYAGSRS